MVLKGQIFKFPLWNGMVFLKELFFLTVSMLGGFGGLERTDFEQFPLWECMVVLKELFFNSFYLGSRW